jgi:hypothetical protein
MMQLEAVLGNGHSFSSSAQRPALAGSSSSSSSSSKSSNRMGHVTGDVSMARHQSSGMLQPLPAVSAGSALLAPQVQSLVRRLLPATQTAATPQTGQPWQWQNIALAPQRTHSAAAAGTTEPTTAAAAVAAAVSSTESSRRASAAEAGHLAHVSGHVSSDVSSSSSSAAAGTAAVIRTSALLPALSTAASSVLDTESEGWLAELRLSVEEAADAYRQAENRSVNEPLWFHNDFRVFQAERALRAVLLAGGNTSDVINSRLQWLRDWAIEHNNAEPLPWPPALSQLAATASVTGEPTAGAAVGCVDSNSTENAAEARHHNHTDSHVSSDVSAKNSTAAAGSTAVSRGAVPVTAGTSTIAAADTSSSNASTVRQRQQGNTGSGNSSGGAVAATPSTSPADATSSGVNQTDTASTLSKHHLYCVKCATHTS